MSPLRSLGSFTEKGWIHQAQSPSKKAQLSYDSSSLSPTADFPTQGDPAMRMSFCFTNQHFPSLSFATVHTVITFLPVDHSSLVILPVIEPRPLTDTPQNRQHRLPLLCEPVFHSRRYLIIGLPFQHLAGHQLLQRRPCPGLPKKRDVPKGCFCRPRAPLG